MSIRATVRVVLACTLLATSTACVNTTTRWTEVAAPQPYRPVGEQKQWSITGEIDTEAVHDWNGAVVEVNRRLTVRINGAVAIEGALPTDHRGSSTGNLTGTYERQRVDADCSSERKNAEWIEIRCRILVADEHAATLVL